MQQGIHGEHDVASTPRAEVLVRDDREGQGKAANDQLVPSPGKPFQHHVPRQEVQAGRGPRREVEALARALRGDHAPEVAPDALPRPGAPDPVADDGQRGHLKNKVHEENPEEARPHVLEEPVYHKLGEDPVVSGFCQAVDEFHVHETLEVQNLDLHLLSSPRVRRRELSVPGPPAGGRPALGLGVPGPGRVRLVLARQAARLVPNGDVRPDRQRMVLSALHHGYSCQRVDEVYCCRRGMLDEARQDADSDVPTLRAELETLAPLIADGYEA
mmetsp:Transcript_11393/g.33367  ORF Transcript_11393/g.33367 Transcript_11393/m.33367 type:complete len:272 (+) Transcript_11393:1057-1872(+)